MNIEKKGSYSTGVDSVYVVPCKLQAVKNITRNKINNVKNKLYPAKRKQEKINKEQIEPSIYFIRLKHYKKHAIWAYQMKCLTFVISDMISKGKDFDEILSCIEKVLPKINMNARFGKKRVNNGHYPLLSGIRGEEYYSRYEKKLKPPIQSSYEYFDFKPKANKEYKSANTCTIGYEDYVNNYEFYIEYGHDKTGKTENLKLAKMEFEKLRQKKNPTLKEINKANATIQWLIAQESPYQKGNDSIANLLTKSIYHAYNISLSPLEKGVSLDFEAFYTDLDEYIEKYPNFFETPPHKLDITT